MSLDYLKTLILFSTLLLVKINAEQNWYNFKTTWGAFSGFYDKPRTVDDAIAAGWQRVSDNCTEGTRFPGIRYAPADREHGPDMILIYDKNGFIAGMHSVVLKRFSHENWQSDSIWYREDVLLGHHGALGEEAYLTTAYFISPDRICNGGRTQTEFDSEGTGKYLFLQNGPSITDVILVPADLEEANQSDFWYRHFCFVNMGRHYFNLNYDVEAPCEPNNIPVQLLYSGDVLNGFVWQHVSAIPGDQWESVSSFALGQIVDRPPNCLYDLVENPGVTTMHVWFRNYETLCITDKSESTS